ncbi:hypothetical protein M409DRAFT_69483 [Zasmidium cellare ATCC 36951]|uniref:Peptidase S33 tripeptidyl aminopeptidase-like C-terminal domain-containing protein n=1 Tax=Zasmidium cellare ATCC 36951 TaxID=1080233 RepID=A0A6A6C4Y5_ZASCE|nr:uncharacterized protein M409DRAFT_69483 [Zasmidium cellare ATCC 36951]KAF2161983.1 hypothetical protein M409DRAFT_69483 [Zasmidium cellare ATCC 36951]
MGAAFVATNCNHQYDGETISWEPCGDVSGKPVECSNITVPMDQFDAENSGDKTFFIPLIRLRGGENATENLLLNPGGPGGSGIEFIFRRGKQLSDIVGDGFHLLSFDPRGINTSTPMASCFPTKEARQNQGDVRDDELVHDSPEVFAWAHNYVQACADTMDEHGAYINTPQTAADMNSILDAVGQEDMVYWGFSYGTILGQTYASLFPDRSKRVIIDGVANNFVWYGDFLDTEQFTDTENVLEGFFDECIKAGKNCSLSSLADTPKELHKLVFDYAANLKEQPLSVYVNSTLYGLFDFPSLFYNGIFPSLYKPASWYSLADNLAKLLKGNATDAWLAYSGQGWGLEGEGNTFVTANDGMSGPEYWPQSRRALLDDIVAKFNGSLFGPTENADAYVRQQWKVPRTHNFTQEEGVETDHPLLILSTTYDPICPLVSAKSANRAFAGSKIVEVQGYGHCSVAVSSTCLAKRVRDFLYNGTLPDDYTKCEVDGPYFIKPEEDGKVVAQKAFDNAEDEKIHIAQLELAKDWDWRTPRPMLM